MPNFLASMGFIIFFLFSTYGFGCLITKFVYKTEKIGWAYSATLGIAGWIIYGGVLNLFRIVTPTILYISLFVGIASALVFLLHSYKGRNRIDKSVYQNGSSAFSKPLLTFENVCCSLLIITVLTFCVYYLMPSRVFNFHDDFHSYFSRAVQLLAEGGFRSNVFSQFGYNSLGGQDFMKTFFLLIFDVSYYNAFDSIICFVLGLALVLWFAQKNRVSFGVSIAAAIIYIFINPQIVNTSSVYSGTLMIMGLIIASFSQHQSIFTENHQNSKGILKAVIPAALLYASMAAVKANLIIYAGLFFLLKASGEFLFVRQKKLVLISNAAVILVSSLFFLPWLFSPSTKYIDVLLNKLFSQGTATFNNAQIDAVQHNVNTISPLFSTADLMYGASWPDYLAIFFVLFVIIVINFFCLIRKVPDFPTGEAITINVASLVPILCLLIMMRMTDTLATALRYNIPLLIAILPISIIFFSKQIPKFSKPILVNFGSALVGVTLIIAGMFTESFIERIEQIIKHRNLMSFSINESYENYMQFSLSEVRVSQMKEAQSYIEEGAEVLAWVSSPFHFDFKQNKILLLESLSNKWLPDFPVDTDVETLWKFLRNKGIQYIIWEGYGYGVKDANWYNLYKGVGTTRKLFFVKSMLPLANHTRLLYNKNSLVVIDIRKFSQTVKTKKK